VSWFVLLLGSPALMDFFLVRYSAFRKHSETMLKTERELNAKLRQLQQEG
jgi:hypothetical protein